MCNHFLSFSNLQFRAIHSTTLKPPTVNVMKVKDLTLKQYIYITFEKQYIDDRKYKKQNAICHAGAKASLVSIVRWSKKIHYLVLTLFWVPVDKYIEN